MRWQFGVLAYWLAYIILWPIRLKYVIFPGSPGDLSWYTDVPQPSGWESVIYCGHTIIMCFDTGDFKLLVFQKHSKGMCTLVAKLSGFCEAFILFFQHFIFYFCSNVHSPQKSWLILPVSLGAKSQSLLMGTTFCMRTELMTPTPS